MTLVYPYIFDFPDGTELEILLCQEQIDADWGNVIGKSYGLTRLSEDRTTETDYWWTVQPDGSYKWTSPPRTHPAVLKYWEIPSENN